MQENKTPARIITAYPKYLWFLTLTYSMVIVFANLFDFRLVQLFSLTTVAGTLIFPLTFLLSDLITEVYGYKHARRAIWCGFLFNALFIAYGQLVIHLPSPAFQTARNAAFDHILAVNFRVIFASGVSYVLAEPFNSYIMAKLKIFFAGRYLGIRFVSSTVIASATDSFVFCTVAFYGTYSNTTLFSIMLTMWFIKVCIEIFGLPISIRVAKLLKRHECLDIYDKNTNFTILSLNTDYDENDNAYSEQK